LRPSIAPPPRSFIASLIESLAFCRRYARADFLGLIRRVAFPFVTLAWARPNDDPPARFTVRRFETILAAALIKLVEVQESETVRVPFAARRDFLIRHFGPGSVVKSANAPSVVPVEFVATTR
jgi:hypothetical protein